MSFINNFFERFTSCIAEKDINKNSNKLLKMQTEKKNSGSSNFPITSFNKRNPKLYDFEKNYFDLIGSGINVYRVKFNSNNIRGVSIKLDSKTNSIVLVISKNKKKKIIPIDDIVSFVYGNHTASFILLSQEVDLIPWKCLSLITKYYTTYDFIVENDEDAIRILTVLEIFSKHTSNLFNFINDKSNIIPIISRMYWQKAYMKVKYNKTHQFNNNIY